MGPEIHISPAEAKRRQQLAANEAHFKNVRRAKNKRERQNKRLARQK